MKKIIKLSFIALLALVVSSCEKYLDEPEPTDVLASTAIYSSREGVEAYLSGVYRRFRRQYESITDVGGIYSIYYARTMKGTDIQTSPSWYLNDYAHQNREQTRRRVTVTWQFLYELIKQANTLIIELESSSLAETDKTELTAHAKALRAYFYFQLALEYQIDYEPTAIAPPIYDGSTIEPQPMSTMQTMFEFIVKDLDDALAGLTSSRLSKSYINKSVAQGIKARVLMYMGQNWTEVQTLANAAYGGDTNASLAPDEYSDGFDDINATEWMWGMDQQDDQTNYYYGAPHVFMDHAANGYLSGYINNDFVSNFSTTDVRALFGIKDPSLTEADYNYYVTSKFTFTFSSDLPLMRTAEMVLIEAEAMYHQGNETGAHDLLFTLQSNRDPNAVKSSNTGTALLDEILLERRKELYAEMGIEWFDAKRLRRGITRTGNHRVPVTLEPRDIRFTLKIPQTEIDANDKISEEVNANR